MRREIIFAVLTVFLISLASCDVLINQQPDSLYNLGDTITVPITVKSLTDVSGTINMDLICNGQDINFYRNDINLAAGEEKNLESSFVLMNHGTVLSNTLLGYCKVKIILNSDYVLTNQFRVSNLITITRTSSNIQLNPGDYLFINGTAVKENGQESSGFFDMNITDGNSSIIQNSGTVNNGIFTMNLSLPKDMKAGAYLVQMVFYEKDATGIKTNQGSSSFYIGINQIPTSLEILFTDFTVQPGTNLEVKAILHDQSGEKMNSTSFITIKDNNDKIMEQVQKNTDEFLEFPIAYDQAPAIWKIYAVSNQLTAEANFQIMENEKVKIDLINKTVIVTNVGNVPYNNTVVVRINNESFPLDVFLNVDESRKFLMSAPDGGYNVEITTPQGDRVSGMAVLTGKSVNVAESSAEGIISIIREPAVWVFIILVLGVGTFLIFNKTRKKSFFGFMPHGNGGERKIGRISEPRKNDKAPAKLSEYRTFVKPVSGKAELSSSIRGEKQDVSMVCLKIRNFGEFYTKGDVRETIEKINAEAESRKAVLYESQDSLFYVFAPMRTRTSKNESSALQLAEDAKGILLNHNRLYKHKLEFGISVNYGTIIAKQEDTLKIMSLGTLMTSAKKIASLAKQEVLLSETINGRVASTARTQMEMRDGVKVYMVKGIKNTEEYKSFIDNFQKKMKEEKDNNNRY